MQTIAFPIPWCYNENIQFIKEENMRLTLDISGSKTHGFLYTETTEE